MNDRIPRHQHDHVLVDVKAGPSGWPTASRDPDSGRGPRATSGMPAPRSDKIRPPRFQGIAAAEAFFSSLEWEVLSRNDFENTKQAQAIVLDWCYGFYNHERRHSAAGMMSPINYENTTAVPDREAA